ncbi:hypothetical protein ACPXA8_27685, partial [Klebsiella pneumoniae]|uniref:hypothetical protein n=1 Tax=Klebsiella pneumoniae TaxID=573 RepID=UPI003CE6F009
IPSTILLQELKPIIAAIRSDKYFFILYELGLLEINFKSNEVRTCWWIDKINYTSSGARSGNIRIGIIASYFTDDKQVSTT